MANKKTLLTFLGIFLILVTLSALMMMIAKPKAVNKNPLRKFDRKDWSRIVFKNPETQIEFENRNQKWVMTKPVVDDVSYFTMEQILNTLARFNVSSVISENPKNFEKFGVDGSSAILVQVFVKERGGPVLDGFIGQKPNDYSITYIRFPKRKAVYIAYDLPIYMFKYSPEEYREPFLVPLRTEEANKFKFEMENSRVDLYLSSNTWICSQTGEPLSTAQMGDLSTLIFGLKKQRYADEAELKGMFEAKQILKVTAEGENRMVVGIVTDITFDGPAKGTNLYLARAEGRQGALLLLDGDVKALTDYLVTISKKKK